MSCSEWDLLLFLQKRARHETAGELEALRHRWELG